MQAEKVEDIILMGDLNISLQEVHDAWEEELATMVEDYRLEYMTDHYMPRRRYRGDGCWTW